MARELNGARLALQWRGSSAILSRIAVSTPKITRPTRLERHDSDILPQLLAAIVRI